MSRSYNTVLLHVVFATKHRMPLISREIETAVYQQMQYNLEKMGCSVKIINGMPDHVHLLFLVNYRIAIADIITQVKGQTSFWINDQQLTPTKFMWQRGFAAFSVSKFHLDVVCNYIAKQKSHHSSGHIGVGLIPHLYAPSQLTPPSDIFLQPNQV